MSYFTFTGTTRHIGRFGLVANGAVLDLTDEEADYIRDNADFTPRGEEELVKTVASAGTPEQIAATAIWFKRATLTGNKAARTPNVGTVYYGSSATNDTQTGEILPGDVVQIIAPEGERRNLADYWIDVVTADDGVVVAYS